MKKPIFDRLGNPLDDRFQKEIHDSQKKTFEDVIAGTQQFIKARINDDTYFFSNLQYISPVIQGSELLSDIKNIITNYVLSQANSTECIKAVTGILSRTNLYTREMDDDIRGIVFNFYMQYDKAYAINLAKQTGMKYFVYLGGQIEDSRDFCVAHNGKVWSIEEAEKWGEWTPADGEYPSGYVIKQKDINKVPSYLQYPSYTPLIDCGGHGCRHHLGFIMKELAYEKRPELKI